MDQSNTPNCSHDVDADPRQDAQPLEENLIEAISNNTSSYVPSPEEPKSFSLASSVVASGRQEYPTVHRGSVPLIIRPSYQLPLVFQPRSDLPSAMSLITSNQPPSLFLQALSKLNESSLSYGLNQLKSQKSENHNNMQSREISPPDSLTNAPPSYSFVLRQTAARRRPRLMGTFIPSPSFVQHTPPPNYATAFDIYVDNPISAPPPRVCNFGFASMPAVCPECGYTGMTVVTSKITLCTHMCAALLCIFCCWICAPLPYILRSCKDVYHYCRSCRSFLGMYCPTNPEHTLP